MKRYLSLGSAIVMGVVSAQAKDTYDFQSETHIEGMRKISPQEMKGLIALHPELIETLKAVHDLQDNPSHQMESDLASVESHEKMLKQTNEDPAIPLDWDNNGYREV